MRVPGGDEAAPCPERLLGRGKGAAEEPEPQPFYEWPKRCATLACRGETAAQQALWEQDTFRDVVETSAFRLWRGL